MGCINRKSFSLQFFLHFACIPCINRPPPSESDTPCYLNSLESACQQCLDNGNIKDNCTQTVVSLSFIVLFDVCI